MTDSDTGCKMGKIMIHSGYRVGFYKEDVLRALGWLLGVGSVPAPSFIFAQMPRGLKIPAQSPRLKGEVLPLGSKAARPAAKADGFASLVLECLYRGPAREGFPLS